MSLERKRIARILASSILAVLVVLALTRVGEVLAGIGVVGAVGVGLLLAFKVIPPLVFRRKAAEGKFRPPFFSLLIEAVLRGRRKVQVPEPTPTKGLRLVDGTGDLEPDPAEAVASRRA